MKSLLKKTMIALAFAFASSVVNAAADSYLYWMLGDNILNGGEAVSYDYAKVKFGETYLNLYDGAENMGAEIGSGLAGTAGYWGMIDRSLTGNTFLFELYNESNEKVGWQSASYSDLAEFITDGSSGHGTYTLTSVVPEPTSGLLMLLGMAGLALRRRKLA